MAAAGKPTPLDDAPAYDAETMDYLAAFNRLSFSRTYGMDANPVQLSEITDYWYRIDAIGELDEFIDIMQTLDAHFLKHRADNRDDG